jgi:hypothetical protein
LHGRWLAEEAALIAALLVAFNPFLVYFSGLLLSETLFTAMLAWAMVLLAWPGAVESIGRARLMWMTGVLLLALAVLVRPGAIGLPVGLAVLGAFVNRRATRAYQLGPIWPLPVGTTALVVTALVLLPWAYRNHRVLGQWVWTSTNAGFTVYDGFNPDADGSSRQDFVDEMPQLRRMDEVGRSDYLTARARDYTDAHPGRITELALAKMARNVEPPAAQRRLQPSHIRRRCATVRAAVFPGCDCRPVFARLAGAGKGVPAGAGDISYGRPRHVGGFVAVSDSGGSADGCSSGRVRGPGVGIGSGARLAPPGQRRRGRRAGHEPDPDRRPIVTTLL